MGDKKNPWADFDNQIKKEREKENELIKKRYSKDKLVKIALNFALKQDFQKALDYFKLVTEKDPKHFLAWVNMGIIYTYHNLLGTIKGRRTAYYKRHYDEGIECFKKALELKPNNIPSLIGLGDAFRGKEEFTKSIEYFERIIKIAPKNSESWRGIGFAYLEMMEFEKAINYFEKAIKMEDKNVDSWIGLGISYFERKNLDESLNCLMNALNYQKQQEKPKKDIIGREIYSNKLETIAKVIYFIKSEKGSLAFINEIEKDFDIKFESKPSILTFFEDTQSKTANQDLIIKKDEELTKSDSKDIKMDRISVLEKKLLTSENENERLTAATELKKIGKEKARLALLKAYNDKSDRVRMKVIETIENSKDIENDILIPYLIKLLDDEWSQIRERSIKTLGKKGNSEILPHFLKKLIDPDEWVRAYAAQAIGNFGNDKAVKYLVSCLKTEIHLVAAYITWALGQIYPRLIKEPLRKKILNLLIAFLQNDKENLDVRSEAAIALGNIGGGEAFKAMLETLNSLATLNSRYFSKDKKNFYKSVIESISYFKDRSLADLLIKILKNELQKGQKESKEEEIILSIIESLGVIGDNKITEILMETLYDINKKIRLASVKSLAKLNDNDVNEKLISMLIDEDDDLYFKSRSILEILIECNQENFVPIINILKKIQNNKDINVYEEIKKNQKTIYIKDIRRNAEIGKISYELSQEEIKQIEEKKKEEIKKIEEKQKEIYQKEFEIDFKNLEEQIKKHDLIKYIQSMTFISEISSISKNRSKLIEELFSLYNKHKNNEVAKEEIIKFIIQFYTPYFEINPFEVDIQNFTTSYNNMRKSELNQLQHQLQRSKQDNTPLEEFYNKLESIDINAMIEKELKRISGEVNEINYNVPVESIFNFLLDFSQILPSAVKTDDSTENEYTLKTAWGPFYFKILEKELNKKIEYEYDFVADIWGEKGNFSIELIEPSLGKVIISTRNNIQEISEKAKENLLITNFLGQYLKTYIDLGIGKVVAKQIQTIFYERTFDDLTMGNYRILQAKINVMGKKFEDLKNKFFEVKAPLTLNSFNCSECGATLNITSKEEKFIICEHCDTPFLMEWQKD